MDDAFENASYGDLKVGFGQRPAILVVDFQVGFTDPRFRMGKSPRIHAARDEAAKLLHVARAKGVPVANCYVGWHSRKEMQKWKISALFEEEFMDGGAAQQLDAATSDEKHDFIFKKCAPSIFFQTPIIPFLTGHSIDTAIIVGCVTSGCIRASTIDAFSYGYRTVVVDDCCGDPAQASHDANLLDIGRRYADIKQGKEVAAYLESLEQ